MSPGNPEIYLSWLESEIKKQKFGNRPNSLYEPLRYIMNLGGKRLRPMLTLLSYSLYRDDAKSIVPIAAAIETFHNFTLLHDDIMDNAPLRRSHPTVHKKWNVNTAILAGDVMQIKVYEKLLGVTDSKLREVLVAFNQCATEVCEGQQLDMEYETKSSITETEYIEMISLKTAVLLGFSLELGAILAGAPDKDKLAMYEFGMHIGIGFQLNDDLLDVYADKTKFGKQVGGDIISNKKTFLLIKAVEKAKGENKRELIRWISAKRFDKRKKVKAVTTIYNDLGIRELTKQKIASYFRSGFRALEKISTTREKTEILKVYVSKLMERQA